MPHDMAGSVMHTGNNPFYCICQGLQECPAGPTPVARDAPVPGAGPPGTPPGRRLGAAVSILHGGVLILYISVSIGSSSLRQLLLLLRLLLVIPVQALDQGPRKVGDQLTTRLLLVLAAGCWQLGRLVHAFLDLGHQQLPNSLIATTGGKPCRAGLRCETIG